MKRIVSVLLAFVLCLCLVPVHHVQAVEVGGFQVTATNSEETLEDGVDYSYSADTGLLTVLSDKAITIQNIDPSVPTSDQIFVSDGVNAVITLAGVNIVPKSGSSFQIADNSKGDVTVILADGTENILTVTSTDHAALQKNGGEDSGTLVIKGNGMLSATGNWNGAGIGGGGISDAANIVIESGTILASAGKESGAAAIGGGYRSDAYNITIKGGTVTAIASKREVSVAWGVPNEIHGGAAIGGGGRGGYAYNVVITGGSVYVSHANVGAQSIGAGSGTSGSEGPTNGSEPVYLYEVENPEQQDIVINGKDYPDCHGDENKIYAYLPQGSMDHPNTVTVGDTTTNCYYGHNGWTTVVDIPPEDTSSFTYTGQELTYNLPESKWYTISNQKQTQAGTYDVTVSLKDPSTSVWSDGTTEDKVYTFTIQKASHTTGLPPCHMDLTENGDGTFTAAIAPVQGAEYSFDGTNWSENNTTTVNHGQTVTGFIRYAETENYVVGQSASVSVTAGHGTLTHHGAVEATCEEDGNTEFWACETCKQYFSDKEGLQEITLDSTVIPATGHHYEGGLCTVCGSMDPDFKPAIISGGNSVWQKGSHTGLTFTSDAAFSHFLKVQVDGKDLDKMSYTVQEGSTIVTLNPAYLETLTAGEHTLAIVSESGSALAVFTVEEKAAGNDNAGNDNAGNDNAGNDNAGNDNAGNDNAGNDNAGNDNAGNDNAGNDNAGNDNAGNDNAGNDNAGNDNAGNDNAGNDNAGNDNTGNDNASNDNTGNDHAMDAPQTGDTGNMALWVAWLLGSGAGLTAMVIRLRQKRQRVK